MILSCPSHRFFFSPIFHPSSPLPDTFFSISTVFNVFPSMFLPSQPFPFEPPLFHVFLPFPSQRALISLPTSSLRRSLLGPIMLAAIPAGPWDTMFSREEGRTPFHFQKRISKIYPASPQHSILTQEVRTPFLSVLSIPFPEEKIRTPLTPVLITVSSEKKLKEEVHFPKE